MKAASWQPITAGEELLLKCDLCGDTNIACNTDAGYDPNVGFYKRKIVLAAGDGAVIGFARRLGFCILFCVCRISFQHIGKLPKTSFKIHTVFVVGTAGCRTLYAADRKLYRDFGRLFKSSARQPRSRKSARENITGTVKGSGYSAVVYVFGLTGLLSPAGNRHCIFVAAYTGQHHIAAAKRLERVYKLIGKIPAVRTAHILPLKKEKCLSDIRHYDIRLLTKRKHGPCKVHVKKRIHFSVISHCRINNDQRVRLPEAINKITDYFCLADPR